MGLVSLLLLTGCGRQTAQAPVTSNAAASENAPAERIVSLAPSVTEIIYALGQDERLVGVTRFCDYPAAARNKPQIGGYYDPNYEAIMALNPDLVILLAEHRDARRMFESVGLSFMDVDNMTVNGVLESIGKIGTACGVPERAAELVAQRRKRMARIRGKTADRPRPRVLVSVGRNMGTGILEEVYVAGRDGFFSELIEIAGGETAYRGTVVKFPVLTREGILALNPDVILDLAADLPSGTDERQDIVDEWNAVAGTRAVQDGRVYVLTNDYVTVPGPRFVQLLEDMARAIHPDVEWDND